MTEYRKNESEKDVFGGEEFKTEDRERTDRGVSKREYEEIDLNVDEAEQETKEQTNEQMTEGKKEKPTSVVKEIFSWIVPLAAGLLLALVIKNYVIINADVPTGSMENTIMPEDRLIGSRLAYLGSDPERGDVVIFPYPDDESVLYIKRIVGLPGETVVIEDGKVYIDGEELVEDYLKEEWVVANGPYTFEVPEDCYLMLGDNRNNSKDARYWDNKYVEKDKILGKAEFIYWPVSHWSSLAD
jgi:signal peptidase I